MSAPHARPTCDQTLMGTGNLRLTLAWPAMPGAMPPAAELPQRVCHAACHAGIEAAEGGPRRVD